MKLIDHLRSNTELRDPVQLKVLIIGNNPIEMSGLYDKLRSLKDRISDVYISFNDKEALKFISSKHPDCIIIDDNYGKSGVKRFINSLKKFKNYTVSLTLLKTANYPEVMFGFQNYLMKEGITADRIYNSLKSSLRFKKKQTA